MVVRLAGGTGPGVDRVVAADVAPMTAEYPAVDQRLVDLAADPVERLAPVFDGAVGVIHLAWSHVDAPPSGARPNLVALRRVLEAAARAGVSSLVHVSSATVYGAWPDNPVPLPEDAALRPNPGFRVRGGKGGGGTHIGRVVR